MKRYLLLLTVSAVPFVIAFGSGCKKTVPTVEAGVEPIATAVEDAAVPAVAEEDAAPAATLTPAKTAAVAPAKSSASNAPGVFAGTYSCFGGMSLQHTGNNVGGRQKPGDNKDFATVTCTVSGDTCDGQAMLFKDSKPAGQKHFTMKRAANGDITYKGDGEAPTLCHKK